MTFRKLLPQSKKRAGISISSSAGRGTTWQLNINIPTTIYTISLKDANKLDICLGEGEDKGKMLLIPNPEGHFEPKRLKHTVSFRLPANEEITPDFDIRLDDVERRDHPEGLVLHLPVWADKERYEAIKRERANAARPPEPQKRVVPMSLR
ncbi:hypothetical protein J2J97_32435 (plasmid) [Rhizobium bangladeshense]|uniref:hypothetical protein n=1 Tax=Rhizobium bangladeshense TaxID=1138189 RepID=UPI001A993318|nr:hypothetical protein [Rhizobium bangladeshense]QSY98614.1 hypothetical protein J2J97_32435 [Rhizobium bangladeshense]